MIEIATNDIEENRRKLFAFDLLLLPNEIELFEISLFISRRIDLFVIKLEVKFFNEKSLFTFLNAYLFVSE